jgi:hypothetical protein
MQKCIFFYLLSVVLLSCGGRRQQNEYPAIDVVGYIKGQLKLLDSIPYGILKVTEYQNGKSDSVYVKKNVLPGVLDPYLNESISKSALENDYIEKSFADAGTETVNITYDAKNKDAEINQIAIYVEPLDGTINRLYITGFFETENGVIKKQLLWKHNKGFQIISSGSLQTNDSTSVTEKYIWQ